MSPTAQTETSGIPNRNVLEKKTFIKPESDIVLTTFDQNMIEHFFSG